MKCTNCGIDFEGRKDAKFCSPNCRVTFSRKSSVVTDNVTLSVPAVTDKFEFYTQTAGRKTELGGVPSEKSELRTAKYWYDVPLGAIPVIRKDWPKPPTFPAVENQPETAMNGRQYFLWWKNEFKMDGESPEILNPFPAHTKLDYYQAGEGSRRWGA